MRRQIAREVALIGLIALGGFFIVPEEKLNVAAVVTNPGVRILARKFARTQGVIKVIGIKGRLFEPLKVYHAKAAVKRCRRGTALFKDVRKRPVGHGFHAALDTFQVMENIRRGDIGVVDVVAA